MASGLLSLKWNNHKSTFFHVLSTIRSKESYCDVTLACDGRFYSLHKFVLSTCSEYFEEMFERTQCKHPVIVLKDIKYDDLEALLNYMYVGEVNVVQEKLAGLIKAAECLKIKGLAVPDEDPMESSQTSPSINREQLKRTQRTDDSPRAKRRRRDNNSSEIEVIGSSKPRSFCKTSEDQNNRPANNMPEKSLNSSREEKEQSESREELKNSSISANRKKESTNSHRKKSLLLSSQKKEPAPEEVTVDEADVKAEPLDAESEDLTEDDLEDNKDSLHHELGFEASDSMGGHDDNYVDVDPSMLSDQPQSVEDVVAQAIPGASGFQENSFPVWEGEGSLSNFPVEGFSGDSSQAHQMVWFQQEQQQQQQHHHDHHHQQQLDLSYYSQDDGASSSNMSESKQLPSVPSHSVFSDIPGVGIPVCPLLGDPLASELRVLEQPSTSAPSFLRSRPQRTSAAQFYNPTNKGMTVISALSCNSETATASKKTTTYKCKFCPNTYRLETYVRKHVRRKHKEKLLTNTVGGSAASYDVPSNHLLCTIPTLLATTPSAVSFAPCPPKSTLLSESVRKDEIAVKKKELPPPTLRSARIRPIRPKGP